MIFYTTGSIRPLIIYPIKISSLFIQVLRLFDIIQITMQVQNTINKDDFFGCMFGGDLKVKQLGKKTIVLMGKSRVGKSTLYNYLLGNQLVGERIDEITVGYQEKFKAGAPIGHSFQSVTLLPNIVNNIQYGGQNHDEAFIDMAGFHDKNRSYIGVFTVSYMLKKVFQETEESKIILVTDHSSLSSNDVDMLTRPFMDFIDILNYDNLMDNQAVMEKFFSSVALVITKAEKDIKWYNFKLKQLLGGLAKLNPETNKKKVLMALVKSIHQKLRIEVFEQAQEDSNPPPCQIIERLSLEGKQWNYYSFRSEIPGKHLFKLPFKDEYESLPDIDKQRYKKADENKNLSIQNSCAILKEFVSEATKNWNSSNPQLSYRPIFEKIRNIVSQHPYGRKEEMFDYLGLKPIIETEAGLPSKIGLELLGQIQKIANAVNDIQTQSSNQEDTNVRLRILEEPVKTLYLHFKETFCCNKQEEEIFLKFMFLNIRALRQCSMINQIDDSRGASALFSIFDGCQAIFSLKIFDIKANFIVNFIPKKSEDINKFEGIISGFIKDELDNISSTGDILKKIQTIEILMKIKKGENLLNKEKKPKEAIFQFIEAIFALNKFKTTLQNGTQPMEDKYRRYIQFKIKEIYLYIGSCLEKMDIFNYSLDIYEKVKAISRIDQCYNKILNSTQKMERKFGYMSKYAKFNEDCGRFEKAIIVYQEILDTFYYKPQALNNIKGRLVSCLEFSRSSNPSQQYRTYHDDLSQKTELKIDLEQINTIKDQVDCWDFINENEENEEDLQILFDQIENELAQKAP